MVVGSPLRSVLHQRRSELSNYLLSAFPIYPTLDYSPTRYANIRSILIQTMIAATRKWLRRNRTPFAIGFGVLGVGYVATQYVMGKISDALQRMSSDRIAREKYKCLPSSTKQLLTQSVYVVDSNKIKKIAHSQY